MTNMHARTDGAAVSMEKLTQWSNEPSVMALKGDLEIAKPSHDTHVAKVAEWLNLRNIEGSAKPKTARNRSKAQPKLVRRQNEWRYSALSEPFLSADTLFQTTPATFEDVAAAEQNQVVLEWQFRTKIDRVKFVDELTRTAVDEGTAVVRVGWKRETVPAEEEVPVWAYYPLEAPEQLEFLQQMIQLKADNPRGFSEQLPEVQAAVDYSIEKGIPVRAVQTGTALVPTENVVVNKPTLDIVHYENFYLDPTAEGDIEKAGFAVLSFETSKAELLKDGRYTNLNKVNWSSNDPLSNPEHFSTGDNTTQFKDELRKRVVAYEYWGWYDIHKNNTLVPIVATWIGDVMIRMEENPFPDQKLPFVVIPYMPIKRSVTGEPDAELLSENQAILGAVTRGMIDLMGRSANGQTGVAKGMLDVVNKRRFMEGNDYEFNPSVHPTHGFYHHEFPEIPQSALTMLSLQNQDAEALTGVKAFSGGLSGEAYGDVAAGIRGMLDAAAKREMAILRRFGNGMIQIGTKIAAMNAVFLSEEEVIRVTNEEFVTVRREDLKGNFDVKVDIVTPEIEEAKAQDLSFMLQTLGNKIDFNITKKILIKIAKLRRMPDLAEELEQFQPAPDPVAEKLKELELVKLQIEIEELQSKALLNRAKARKELSEADQADLNFLEQETGTKHERDIDKLGAQAEANERLEVTKAALKAATEPARPN